MVELAATAILGAAATAGGAWLRTRTRREQQQSNLLAARARGLAAVEAEQAAAIAVAESTCTARAEALQRELAERATELNEQESDQDRLERSQEVRAESVTAHSAEIDAQYDALKVRRADLQAQRRTIHEIDEAVSTRIEEAAHATRGEVLTELRETLGTEAMVAARKAAARLEEQTKGQQEQLARATMDLVCQRYGAAPNTNRLVSVVLMPKRPKIRERLLSDNQAVLQAITAATDVRFERLDEEQFLLKAPDPYTREIGRLTYERLIRGGNLTEPLALKAGAKAAVDLEKMCRDAGKRAARLLKIRGIHPDILYLVGKLLYRTSYTQNQWQHAIEAAQLCAMMAESMGMDPRAARRAALLHDIGKVLYAETEATGSHAVSGAKFARDHGETDEIVHPIAAHHNDEAPSTPLAHLVAAADALSGARPGARRETMESFSERVAELERICGTYREVDKAFVIQGGREVRIVVDPHRVDDMGALELSGDVAARIEEECVYPGQIKVTVMREIRSSVVARCR
jgi:ribonuclease Y